MFIGRKKLFAGLLLFISFIVIGWFLIYEFGVKILEKSLNRVEANLVQKGYVVSYEKVALSGNPFLLKITFYDIHLKDPRGLVEWQGPEVEVQAMPWKIKELTCLFKGVHKITIPQTIPISLGVLEVNDAKGVFLVSSDGKLEDISLTVDRISSLLAQQLQPVYIDQFFLNVKDISKPSQLTFSLNAQVRNIENVLNLPPYDHPFQIELDAKFSGYEPKSLPTTLAAWRDGGGVLDVMQLKVVWLPLIIQAQGTLTLDKEMYPLGSFSSKIIGYRDALNDMVNLGWVKKKRARTAAFMLELLSVPDEEYGRKLTVPITLQNKMLSIGPAPLLKLDPLKDF